MKSPTPLTKGKSSKYSAATKKRAASSSASGPAVKKARAIAPKTPKMAKTKKGPACAACRKKKTKCAHRLELDSVTNQPISLPPPLPCLPASPSPSSTKPATPIDPSRAASASPPASSSYSSSSSSTRSVTPTDPSRAASASASNTTTPDAPKKIQKHDKDRNATLEYRQQIFAERNSCRILFTSEDWYMNPKWASRVYGSGESPDEKATHAKKGKSSAGTPPALSFCGTESSVGIDTHTRQNSAESSKHCDLVSTRKDVSAAELAWLRKVECWKVEAIALVNDEGNSSEDWSW